MSQINEEILSSKIEVNQMSLESGIDILSKELSLIFKQPKLIEISQLGENNFIDALATINFDKNILKDSPDFTQEQLDKTSDFLWIMIIIKNNKNKFNNLLLLFQIIFRDYEVIINIKDLNLTFISKKNSKNIVKIADINFPILKQYINEIFHLNKKSKSSYNPTNKHAERIAKKLEKGRQKVKTMKGEGEGSALCNGISSLAVALHLPISTVYEKYTIYQFHNQLARYQKQEEYGNQVGAMLAGASDIKITNWYEDL